jgi:Ca2+/Na+ antiporter
MIILSIIMMVLMSIVIAKACDGFEVATNYLGRNMSNGVKGATLNAIGSSMPELLTTVFFLITATQTTLGYNLAASIGGDTGSAIFNSIVIPTLVIIVILTMGLKGAKISRKVILRDGLFLIAAEIILLILLSSDVITAWHGWAFTAFYLIYLGYTLRTMDKNDKDEMDLSNPEDRYERYIFSKNSTIRAWIVLSITMSIIAVACHQLVHWCEVLSIELNINMLFVSLVLVAAASSVPDTIISIKDARNGNHDDALSNVLGSNIFDITISMGLPLALFLMIKGISIDFHEAGITLIDIRVMLLIITAITIGIFYFSKIIGKKQVIMLIILYTVFILYAIGAAQYHKGSDTFLANMSGNFIEFFQHNIGEQLRDLANNITRSWK